jgi:uncharacterized membrane protein YbjE (DUF340 family)
MKTLVLYIGITVVGYLAGAKAGIKPMPRFLTAVIAFLVFIMGSRIGASEEIIASLGTIGLQALAYTLIIMVTAVLAFSLVRRLLGFDRYGRRIRRNPVAAGPDIAAAEEPRKSQEAGGGSKPGINKMTILIISCVALGILAGHFILPDAFMERTDPMLTISLCLLLVLIGLDIGADGTIGANFRATGWRVFLFPLASILAMAAGSLIAAPLLSLSVQDSLCVGAGFGWYTLAPAMLASYSAEVSAMSFLHNVFRELFGLVLIPVAASKIGYLECIALPGSPAMDVCLPVVEQSASGTTAIYSFITGATLSAAVPILVSLCMGL